uniref:DUF4230 domain-containing protein n=1 Tax=uncultured Sphingomonas sp. TaxID=158754 RepID=UPI0035C97EE5
MNTQSPLKLIATIVLLVAAVFALRIGYDRYTEKYVVERDEGEAIDKVVQATFARAAALKVGTLSGTIQSTASDVRWGGWLRSGKVVKAPFTVEYFVDVAGLSAGKYRWDAQHRQLTVEVPDVTVAHANVDESAVSVSTTTGLIVTRDAADALARKVSAKAQRGAQAEAQKPEHIAAARENARRALANLFRGSLAAAQLGDVDVVVRFPYERRGDGERWDTTRSIGEVLGNGV